MRGLSKDIIELCSKHTAMRGSKGKWDAKSSKVN